MRVFLSFVMALGLWGAVASANQDDVKFVIESQMEAFKADDMAGAFDFAADGIQKVFGTAERFGEMVRRGYPMVHRPEEVVFLEFRQEAGSLWQKVLVTDQSGVVHVLDYEMIPTESGWRIGAVLLMKRAVVGT
ncbi:DUF4864 domain-containing protein [Shimia sp. W99]|uniref:DUF4864 domain-containing protein n=1 Tax=Shimia aestuarii TaxID=254406 RepID=A0A1I4RW64_9RHOB|nr:DUF4864 domain-containing protein [Shimia aestuarii]SFM56409.1 protein of unknown function [Shimia aestuarii]